ncbi:MAG: universal stress protein [Gammaproteobacteria bacterium]|jgi:nucleotide-binding universal stress UspA family protein
MEQTILIPIDGTESVAETLLYVRSISPKSKDQSHIILMHVTPSVDSVNAAVEIHPNVDTIHNELSSEGWDVKRETRMGDPVREIIKMAILLPATMILMSTHGRTGIERIREGSVTEQVLKQSPCPVFILHSSRPAPSDKRTENLFKRILVPLDGTEASAAIISCVERFAKMHDSEVIIFHDELEHAEYEEEKAVIKAKLQEQSVALANNGLKVSLDMTTYKKPIREILNRIDELNIDLVSMATHGTDGDKIAMDESVTAEVIRHSNCPLLVWSAEPQCPTVND